MASPIETLSHPILAASPAAVAHSSPRSCSDLLCVWGTSPALFSFLWAVFLPLHLADLVNLVPTWCFNLHDGALRLANQRARDR